MMHDTNHGNKINFPGFEIKLLYLHKLTLDIGVVLQEYLRKIELLLARLGEDYFVGILLEEYRQTAVATANIDRSFKMLAFEQVADSHFLCGMLIVTCLPVIEIVKAWVIILVCFFGS